MKAEQVAQPFWKEKASQEWKDIYQEKTDYYVLINYIDPPDLEANIETCKEIISHIGDQI